MTSDQKHMSMALEILCAAKGLPLTGRKLEQECRYAGYAAEDFPGILRQLLDRKLISEWRDPLGGIRYHITDAGKEALHTL